MLDMALSVLESEIDIVKNEIQIPEAAGRLSIEELSIQDTTKGSSGLVFACSRSVEGRVVSTVASEVGVEGGFEGRVGSREEGKAEGGQK